MYGFYGLAKWFWEVKNANFSIIIYLNRTSRVSFFMKSFISFLTNDVCSKKYFANKTLRPVCILLRPLLHKYKYNFVKLWRKKNLFWPTKQMQKAHKINKLQGSSRLLLVLTSSSLKLHSHFSHHFTWKRIKLLSCIGLHRLKLKIFLYPWSLYWIVRWS